MPERRKPNVIFHVNMLKRWVEPELVDETGFLIEEADDESNEPVPDNMHNGKRLSLAQQQELKKLLEKFTPIMSNNPGRTHLIEHHIRTSGKKAIRQPPYRLPRAFRDEVIAELQDMVKAGIMVPSQSEWAFPMVIVKKKDGKARICIDYRKLNAVTEGDAYPMPRIDNILDDLGQSQFITTLDLAKGYLQVPVAKEDQEKTAFVSPLGLFHFQTMPFGLCGAPATFQWLMDQVIRGLPFARAYLGDLVVFSHSWDEHVQHLRTVFNKIQAAGLTIKAQVSICSGRVHLPWTYHWTRMHQTRVQQGGNH